jgi:lipid-A-disaccharide synthase-like uncharacterized protein
MYVFDWENGHVIWRELWYALVLGVSLWVDIYMIHKDQVFVAVVVIDLIWKMMVTNVIS